MRRLYALLVLGAAFHAALWAACGGSSSPQQTIATPTVAVPADIVIPPGANVTVGVSAALSGEQQALGNDLLDATRIAVSLYGGTIKGHPIEVVPGDDGCSRPLMAVDVADTLIARETLVGVIGPMCTTGALAANPRYERAGVVHISPSVTRTDISALGDRFFFRTAWRDDAQASVQATFARAGMAADTAIVISDRESYGNALAEAFSAQFDAAGGRVLEHLTIARGTVDLSGVANQIVDADPDVVVFEGINPEGALLVLALAEAQYGGGFIGPDGLLNARDFLLPAGDAARGAVITGGATPSGEYVAAFETLYGRPLSTAFVLQAHDATTALLKAIDASATLDDDGTLRIGRERLAAALREQRFAGLTGSITFDERGDRRGASATELGITVYRVDFGVFATVQ
jgi:branched-chain amino acid transport system substrate-binding protein